MTLVSRARPTTPPPASPGPGTRRRLPAPLALVRPGQWPKNLLVVPLPLLGATARWDTTVTVALATAAFVLASSLVYIVNDIADVERDRRHPVKRHRPLASGRLRTRTALALGALLAALLTWALIALGPAGSWPVLGYLALNAAYSWRLKHLPLLDVFTVAGGFVLRLLGGYAASGRPVAGWLVLTVLTLCLLLILGKRRHELGVSGTGHRPALAGYSAHFLDLVLVLCAALTTVGYLLHLRLESGLTAVAAPLTAPCALFALFRYLQIVTVRSGGGDPVRTLLLDRAMVAAFALWAGLLATAHLFL
ncbi:decaprenyl-phosphate phosphoribosyltransferase [Streptomyces inusitatus]|uniref:Decaprenyl-phosphate phosphoribosyltransferase n=1 Tax=Streptomyces inusitatus TaxID=68221 RepID=A0A918Q3W6_9ACTN|nr:UbiA prenyltransferase family protein [Streptomyces inusitatus]GGZ31299.1 decaprenyl-phosphate phosphoribosyltransferase [Streptomyces inusitatus]